LWEIVFLWDHDDDGLEEWYVATLSVRKRVLVRLQHDDLNLRRYLPFTPFPRADSVYGYSFVGHKLATVTAEHTALRNMIADRSALATQAPIKRVQGALWDPDMQPFGRAPSSTCATCGSSSRWSSRRAAQRHRAGEEHPGGGGTHQRLERPRLGTQPTESRTLGEVQLTTEQSFVRMEESIRHCQETLEDLFQLRHAIWIRALEQQETGIEAPPCSWRR